MVVMFTLKRHGTKLLGPINRKLYASFAPKQHAFAIARRDATKRGFGPGAGKLIQIVTDGDPDFATYATEYFPEAMHTMDVMHVIEKLWTAGECCFREGTEPLRQWIEAQKDRLYAGKADEIIAELCQRRHAIAVTGPGNKGKRERLLSVIGYLQNRVHQMPYDKIIKQDLELGSGAVEGAVKNIIGKRCDHGGMRWIEEPSTRSSSCGASRPTATGTASSTSSMIECGPRRNATARDFACNLHSLQSYPVCSRQRDMGRSAPKKYQEPATQPRKFSHLGASA
jgi:hypothetical protein